MQPLLTVIAIFFNMRREARRTLFTLSAKFQRGINSSDYRVLAIDNGSSEPLDPREVKRLGNNFVYQAVEPGNVSPVAAINDAVKAARSEFVCILIDGARMVTPGLLHNGLLAIRLHDHPLVVTLGWHLGNKLQNLAMEEGYNQAVEDQLLRSVDWKADGYRLFDISSLAASSGSGFFGGTPSESNCFLIRREDFLSLGGYDTRFVSPGGGLANLDFFERALREEEGMLTIILLGEGNFHQFHHGVSTNVLMAEHPRKLFAEEYFRLHGRRYSKSNASTAYFGRMPPQAVRFCLPDITGGDAEVRHPAHPCPSSSTNR